MPEPKKIPAHLLAFFILLLFIAVSAAAYLLLPDAPKNSKVQPPKNTTTAYVNTAKNNFPTNTLSNSVLKEDRPSTNTATKQNNDIKTDGGENIATGTVNNTTKEEKQTNFQTTTLKVADRTYELRFNQGDSLLKAMQLLTARSEQPFMFSGKDYPGLGYFVEEINGSKYDPAKQLYWIYYVNGAPAQIGISNYYPKPGDAIEWKLEKSKF